MHRETPKCADGRARDSGGNAGATGADPIEAALAKALEGATAAGEWAIVAQLAGELQARRTARAGANVIALDPKRRERGS